MSRDGQHFGRLALTIALSLLLLAAGGCDRALGRERANAWRERAGAVQDHEAANYARDPAPFTWVFDVVYASPDGRDLHLDLAVPTSPGPHPIALYIHGGGWSGGNKKMGWPMQKALAARGYLAASVEYRLTGVAPWPAQIEDCRAAADWLVAHAAEYGGDPARFAVTGGSAGGHLALCLALGWGAEDAAGTTGAAPGATPPEQSWPGRPVKACCAWYGPTDLTRVAELPAVSKDLAALLGQTRAGRERTAPLASPILYVDAHDPPVLMIHGAADPLVPIAQSERLLAALKAVGVPAELIPVEGGGHGVKLGTPEEWAALTQRMIDWFDQQLATPAANP